MSDTSGAPAQAVAMPPKADASGLVGDDAAGAMVSLYQKQKKIYARAVSGLFATWRWSLVWFTQILFYGLPWLPWNGRQAVLFDLGTRRFYIGPLVLYPQDFIYLTAILIISAYALFLFTAVAGRLWCGFACPQTVYTEIFMWVEKKIEGDRIARMRLDDGPWTANKLWRKSAKQAAWIVFSLWTGFTFVGYFTPIQNLAASAATLGFGPWEWFWVLFYGLATYGNAGFLREQVCKYMCPYARFQSAMFDKDTLIISYDSERGEPRGSRSRKADPRKIGKGDCIDCGLCVQVCPTGIDIRDGLQYECIGCAACVDACDKVMDRMNYPRGLIRYTTQNGLANHWTTRQIIAHALRPRVLVYSAILAAVTIALFAHMLTRVPLKVDVIRDRGSLGREVEDGMIENVYSLQIINTAEVGRRYRLTVSGIESARISSDSEVDVPRAEARLLPVRVRINGGAARPGTSKLMFQIEAVDDRAVVVREKSTFFVPR